MELINFGAQIKCMRIAIRLLPALMLLVIFSYSPPAKKRKYIDPANMDLNVRPGDNFYLYANGNWISHNPVPASKTRWGSFDELRQEGLNRIRLLCEQAAANTSRNTVYQRVGDFYTSAMDSTAIERLGNAPLKAELDRLGALGSAQDILREIARLRTEGMGTALFGFRISQDEKNASAYIPSLSQGGLSLPDRDYYLKNDARSQRVRTAYYQYISDMFKLVGDEEKAASRKATDILGLETGLAKLALSRVELRDPVKNYHKYSVADFSKTTPGMDWTAILANLQIHGADSLVVNNPGFFKSVDALLSAVPLDTWKAYLQWSVIRTLAADLSNAFVQRQFEFNRVITGQKEIPARWERMTARVDGSLGELLGQLYVEKYFTDSAKKRMLALVNNVQQTFGERISRLDWMSQTTKEKALEKLHAIVNKIGFPDKWETYDGVVIKKDDFIGNMRSINAAAFRRMVDRMGKPVDKTRWGMTPPTINANYNATNNEISFPAGILQFPFYDFGADDAINYGGIAAVIGHELTHGFDDEGRKFGPDGNLHDWWTADDAKKFEEHADQVVDQYNAFTVNDSIHVNGRLTLGENLADLGGLNIAYEAFKKTPEGKSGKKIDGFTPDQRFFLSWAQIWRSNTLPETSAQLILTDPHSPGMYRCNAPITNMDAWYAAFDVKEGDKMFTPKDKRIRIW
jgi:putative endopeptidase